MAVRDYIINRSNYTVRKKMQKTAKGVVYERDYMTTTQPGSWDGDVFSYSAGNFKMTTRRNENTSRKHEFGGWIKSGCADSEKTSSDVWMLSCMNVDEEIPVSDETKIVLKPNKGSLLDFAYYSSISDLLQITVKYIADQFPAELTITDNVPQYWDTVDEITRNIGYNLGEQIPDGILSQDIINQYSAANVLVEVSNPYEIDVTSKDVNTNSDDIINPLRYFCLSGERYGIVKSGELTEYESIYACPCNWECVYKKAGCVNGEMTGIIILNNGFKPLDDGPSQLILFEFYNEGQYILMTHKAYVGYSIRPYNKVKKLKYMDIFYDGMPEIGKTLLDRYSTPKYTCEIDVPRETEYGIFKSKSQFRWPTLYGYNIDIFTGAYEFYMSQMIEIAAFYDEGYTDNLWNRMTHSAIKNMDETFIRPNSLDTREDYEIGTSKIQQLLKVFAYFFDKLKTKARNIKQTNILTYDENNNIPDYFVSDVLSLHGWDVYQPTNGLSFNDSYFTINGKRWSPSDVNVEFERRLALNSTDILTAKGTKSGIEKILSLFGLRSYDYARALLNVIKEQNSDGTTDMFDIKSMDVHTDCGVVIYRSEVGDAVYNQIADRLRQRCIITLQELKELLGVDPIPMHQGGYIDIGMTEDESEHELEMVFELTVITEPTRCMYDYKIDEYVTVASGGESGPSDSLLHVEKYNMLKWDYDAYEDSMQGLPCVIVDNGVTKYIVPWYTSPAELDGHMYFQMYGGWGKMRKKIVDFVQPFNGKTTLFNDKTLYDETIKYIHTVDNIESLTKIPFTKLQNKTVCYVFDTNDYSDYYGESISNNATNYFYLEDANNFDVYGENEEDGRIGWVNISELDINNHASNEKGTRVLYLESLIDDTNGNNPHVGYGKYDNGEEYLNYYRQLFKYAINNNGFTDDAYECADGEIKEGISSLGFNLTENRDNVKVWYFYDNENSIWYKKETTEDGTNHKAVNDMHYDKIVPASSWVFGDPLPIILEESIGSFYETNLQPYDFETDETSRRRTESGGLSVINSKRMTLTFDSTYTDNTEFRNYYFSTINQYVKQLIPSTTIFEVKFEITDSVETTVSKNYGYAAGLTESSEVLVERYNT